MIPFLVRWGYLTVEGAFTLEGNTSLARDSNRCSSRAVSTETGSREAHRVEQGPKRLPALPWPPASFSSRQKSLTVFLLVGRTRPSGADGGRGATGGGGGGKGPLRGGAGGEGGNVGLQRAGVLGGCKRGLWSWRRGCRWVRVEERPVGLEAGLWVGHCGEEACGVGGGACA